TGFPPSIKRIAVLASSWFLSSWLSSRNCASLSFSSSRLTASLPPTTWRLYLGLPNLPRTFAARLPTLAFDIAGVRCPLPALATSRSDPPENHCPTEQLTLGACVNRPG